ncbi:hypothetical protein DPEC_G00165150 [Dallia pectoralis]|uniref:Uncharacterized protein n=1 Tax=Dallia pectoralis TaxID=75939 RepID=A0ACC2GHD6_DALPE|nr:hypothetical protein DPEC_G00165150 [Dallia pectoralis]
MRRVLSRQDGGSESFDSTQFNLSIPSVTLLLPASGHLRLSASALPVEIPPSITIKSLTGVTWSGKP